MKTKKPCSSRRTFLKTAAYITASLSLPLTFMPFKAYADESSGRAEVKEDLCFGCEACLPECPVEAIYMYDYIAKIDHDLCTGCLRCYGVCPTEAILFNQITYAFYFYDYITLEPSGSYIFKVMAADDDTLLVEGGITTDLVDGSELSDIISNSPFLSFPTQTLLEIIPNSTLADYSGCVQLKLNTYVPKPRMTDEFFEEFGNYLQHRTRDIQNTDTIIISLSIINSKTKYQFGIIYKDVTYPVVEYTSNEGWSVTIVNIANNAHDYISSNKSIKVNTSACTGCGKCISVCQVNAIIPTYRDLKLVYVSISASSCNLCSACIDVCPTSAIEETGR